MLTRHIITLPLVLSLSIFFAKIEAAPVHLVEEQAVKITSVAPRVVLVDFGRVAFGNILINTPQGKPQEITVHFGESMEKDRINRKPPGTVRYASITAQLQGGEKKVVAPKADERNIKQPAAVLTPAEWGVVLPFRWVEIEGWNGEITAAQIKRQSAFATTWDDDAAHFSCSDEKLNRIWDLCKYSIKATTFAGVYVDGDRERIPYEADAYLNQLSHYATDKDVQMARDTYDRLMKHPTWPTEWASHMIFMAHADLMHTGDTKWLTPRFEALKTKLLLNRARADGLLVSNAAQVKRDDIVDWPVAERDGFVFKPVNTVVNAFHIRSLEMMAEMANKLNRKEESKTYDRMANTALISFNEKLFDATRGIYRDGEGTDHNSIHATLFPLAFGLVPKEQQSTATAWLEKRGMACSVYAAQYLFEGLFQNESSNYALSLMTANNDRSWSHMVESDTTITWEAWDQRYKPNQDWNHAWGAAPANLLPRFVLGAQPLTPGWTNAIIRPNIGSLTKAAGKVPTPRGPILIDWKNGATFEISLKLPQGTRAQVQLPASASSTGVYSASKKINAARVGQRWVLQEPVSGDATFIVK